MIISRVRQWSLVFFNPKQPIPPSSGKPIAAFPQVSNPASRTATRVATHFSVLKCFTRFGIIRR